MSLESVRKLRAQTEEVVTMELAHITQELVRLEQQCRSLDAVIQADAEAYGVQTEQGLAIEAVLEWHERMDSQQSALKRARGAVDDLTALWKRTHTRLVEAAQERKILDRLAERHCEAHRVEVRHREQVAMDDAASRRTSSGGEPST